MEAAKIVWWILNWVGIPSYITSFFLLINLDIFKAFLLLIMGSVVVMVRLFFEVKKGIDASRMRKQEIKIRDMEIREKEMSLEEKEIEHSKNIEDEEQ